MFGGYEYRYVGMLDKQIEDSLYREITTATYARYGTEPDGVIMDRIKAEWDAVKRTDLVPDIAFLHEFTTWMRIQHIPCQVRPGGSLIMYLLGIVLTNPLRAHHYCLRCHKTMWEDVPNGFDLEEPDNFWLTGEHRTCECGSAVVFCDGHDIPWQMVFGGVEHFFPQLQISLPADMEKLFPIFFEHHWLVSRFDAQLRPIGRKGPPGFQFLHTECSFVFDPKDFPETYYSKEITADIRDTALLSWRQLMLIDMIPDDLPEPRTFAELIANFCLIHGTGLWNENAKFMVERLNCSTVSLLSCQEDVFDYYCKHGYLEKNAWLIMRGCRFGTSGHYFADHSTEMVFAKDSWMLNQINQPGIVLWTRAYATEQILHQLKRFNMEG